MSEPKQLTLTRALRNMLERIERQSGQVQLLQITSLGQDTQLNKLRAAGYVVKCEHPTVIDRRYSGPAEALAITDAGKIALRKRQGRVR
jgi:hypothetical protein